MILQSRFVSWRGGIAALLTALILVIPRGVAAAPARAAPLAPVPAAAAIAAGNAKGDIPIISKNRQERGVQFSLLSRAEIAKWLKQVEESFK